MKKFLRYLTSSTLASAMALLLVISSSLAIAAITTGSPGPPQGNFGEWNVASPSPSSNQVIGGATTTYYGGNMPALVECTAWGEGFCPDDRYWANLNTPTAAKNNIIEPKCNTGNLQIITPGTPDNEFLFLGYHKFMLYLCLSS